MRKKVENSCCIYLTVGYTSTMKQELRNTNAAEIITLAREMTESHKQERGTFPRYMVVVDQQRFEFPTVRGLAKLLGDCVLERVTVYRNDGFGATVEIK